MISWTDNSLETLKQLVLKIYVNTNPDAQAIAGITLFSEQVYVPQKKMRSILNIESLLRNIR